MSDENKERKVFIFIPKRQTKCSAVRFLTDSEVALSCNFQTIVAASCSNALSPSNEAAVRDCGTWNIRNSLVREASRYSGN
ncbi:hypothetical protein ANTRET_LOCUS5136 [Anthophora retusa]